MLTMRDIAARVGVSVSTVSLVLNDRDRGRVKADIAASVRQVADDMGYVPNLLARGLKTKQTHTIGVLSDEVASVPFAGQLLAGAQQAAWHRGYVLMLVDTGGKAELERPGVQSLLQRNIEGLIVAAEFHRELSLPTVPDSVPVVVLDGRAEGDVADAVVPDEAGGAYAGTRCLVEAGHRRIAFCTVADDRFVACDLRLAGYQQALAEAGIGYDPALVVAEGPPSASSGRGAAERLLRLPDRPTGVFCFSDQLAMGVYQIAQRMGLRIPQDLSVVGFDNQQFVADYLLPGLTTVQLPHKQMGQWAAEQVIARITHPDLTEPTLRLMDCPLVVRDSVAPLPPRRGGQHPARQTPRTARAPVRTP